MLNLGLNGKVILILIPDRLRIHAKQGLTNYRLTLRVIDTRWKLSFVKGPVKLALTEIWPGSSIEGVERTSDGYIWVKKLFTLCTIRKHGFQLIQPGAWYTHGILERKIPGIEVVLDLKIQFASTFDLFVV